MADLPLCDRCQSAPGRFEVDDPVPLLLCAGCASDLDPMEDDFGTDLLCEGPDCNAPGFVVYEGRLLCVDCCPTVASLDTLTLGMFEGVEVPIGKCPRCGEQMDRDEVDVGVGVIHGPWGCGSCGYSEHADAGKVVDGRYHDIYGGAHSVEHMVEAGERFGLGDLVREAFGDDGEVSNG